MELLNLVCEECDADGNIAKNTKSDDEGVECYKNLVTGSRKPEIFILSSCHEYYPRRSLGDNKFSLKYILIG